MKLSTERVHLLFVARRSAPAGLTQGGGEHGTKAKI